MPATDLKTAIDEWRAADQSARAAEVQLQHAWMQHAMKPGTPIPDDLIQWVADRRSRANARLSVALALMGAVPRKSDHPGDRAERSGPR